MCKNTPNDTGILEIPSFQSEQSQFSKETGRTCKQKYKDQH